MSIPDEPDPLRLFSDWYALADHPDITDRTAMNLATATAEGRPSSRMVLLKQFDADGFVFYTNLSSRKASQLRANPYAALCFHWRPIGRQVRIEGSVTPVSEEEADTYFASRDRSSQLGAWASKQSQEMKGRHDLEKRVAKYTAKFNVGKVPRPEFWSGFRVKPSMIEFWLEGRFRLHERMQYTRDGNDWTRRRLYP